MKMEVLARSQYHRTLNVLFRSLDFHPQGQVLQIQVSRGASQAWVGLCKPRGECCPQDASTVQHQPVNALKEFGPNMARSLDFSREIRILISDFFFL